MDPGEREVYAHMARKGRRGKRLFTCSNALGIDPLFYIGMHRGSAKLLSQDHKSSTTERRTTCFLLV